MANRKSLLDDADFGIIDLLHRYLSIPELLDDLKPNKLLWRIILIAVCDIISFVIDPFIVLIRIANGVGDKWANAMLLMILPIPLALLASHGVYGNRWAEIMGFLR